MATMDNVEGWARDKHPLGPPAEPPSPAAWKKAVTRWVQRKLIEAHEEQRLLDALNGERVALLENAEATVDAALAEAISLACGDGACATWAKRWRAGSCEDPDPCAPATIARIILQVAPDGAAGVSPGELPSRLLGLVVNGGDNSADWALYAAAQAARALVRARGPNKLRPADNREKWADCAWLLACLALVLIRRTRSYAP